MGKPWARIEVGYLDHPKFLALTANAICLWHEGKNYCDKHQTDGLIPKAALTAFRFRRSKSVTLLLASCGQKGDGTPYAPLWEPHAAGFMMHDYLDHNDCREAVLARITQAEESRVVDRERLKRWRANKQKRSTDTPFHETVKRVSETLYTETPTVTKETKTRTEESPEPEPGSEPPVFTFQTVGNPSTWDVSRQQVEDWAALYPNLLIEDELRKALAWVQATPGKRKTAKGMARFLVNWLNRATDDHGRPHRASFSRRGAEPMPVFTPWECPHVDPCSARSTCLTMTALGRPRKTG